MAELVLLRHGESVWNKLDVFTGWVDIPLSPAGIEEALKAGDRLCDKVFDAVFVSSQVRSMETAMLCLSRSKSEKTPVIIHEEDFNKKFAEWTKIHDKETEKMILPVYRNWELNERFYGDLQGKNKKKTASEYGEEKVQLWRRSFDVRPPNGESLKDTSERAIPFFRKKVVPLLEKGKNVLVSAHGNSLRSVVMYLNGLTEEQVVSLEIPTGVPMFFGYVNGRFIRKEESPR